MTPACPRRAMILGTGATVLAAIASPGMAQTSLAGPVTLVVARAPGGLGEVAARAISDKLAKAVGQPVEIDFRPGASGSVGAQSVASAAPDGRTLLLGQTAEIVIEPYLIKDFNPTLEPIALVAIAPLALVTRAAAPYSSVREFLQAAPSSGRELSFASAGRYTPGYFAAELLRSRTGARFRHVPFDGGGPALNALVDGRADFFFATLPSAIPLIRAGKLKALAVSSGKRAPALPDVPTLEESGIRRFDVTLWAGVFAPRGASTDIVSRLNRDINQILGQPDVRDGLVQDGAIIMPVSADQFRDFIRDERGKYRDFISSEFCSQVSAVGCQGLGALPLD
jgi:tripartite-type tricarboxylate transporter receptor subunit TctC